MPIYEFVCYSCGVLSEKLCKIGESNFSCPECGSTKTEKKVSAPSVHLPVSFNKNERSDLDRMIGSSSEKRWDKLNTESEKRNEVRKKYKRKEVGRKPDGSYVPLGDNYLSNRERGFSTFMKAKTEGVKVTLKEGNKSEG